jgi:hypothetical protein
MTEEERRAAEIQKAMVARSRADADEDADANGKKLNRLLSFLEDMQTKFGARLDALEARGGGANGAEGDEDGGTKLEQRGKATEVAADEAAAVAEIQSRFDSMAHEHGLQAPRAMIGESAKNYRLRMLRQFQRHSAEFKDADFTKIVDPKTLDGIEQRIAADSHDAAMRPVVEPGRLLEITRPDKSGRMISTFYGPSTFVKLMTRPPRYIQSVKRDWK